MRQQVAMHYDHHPERLRPGIGLAAAATANPLASRAALDMLAQGGAAIDATIAAQAVLSLVEPNASGLGGGAMLLYRAEATGQVHAFDGLSAAPARVPDRLETDFDGRTVPAERAVFGGRTVGVPGCLRALELAHRRFGRLPWPALFAPAIALATEGFPLSPYLNRTLTELPVMREAPFARALYCGGGTLPLPAGTVLRNPDFARTLTQIAEGGADALYLGEIAAEIVRVTGEDLFPGTLTAADLAEYRAVERTPLHFALGGWTVLAAPPPCFGGLSVGQIIGIAERLGLQGLGERHDEAAIHVLAEAGFLAQADRALWAADPDHVAVPAQALLNPAYLADRAALIGRERHIAPRTAGTLPDGGELGTSMTSHVAIADARGDVASLTTTINQNFGARLVAGGFWLNNVLTNFAANPVVRGQRVANAAAPRKRPRTSIAPCIVLDAQGQPLAAIGAGGGNRIPGYVSDGLLRLAGGMRDPQAIVAAPHAMGVGGLTEIEPALEAHAAGLAARGHYVVVRRMDGGTQCLVRDGERIAAGADIRRDGVGMGLG
jgi:gamma-glutamyltranspeptidase/glutathione hydrolase